MSTLLLAAAFAGGAAAPAPSPDPLAGAGALDIARAAIAAHGGEAFHHPRSLQLRGSATYYPTDGGPPRTLQSLTISRVIPSASTSARDPNGRVRADAWSDGRVFFREGFDGRKPWSELSEEAKPVAEYLRLDRHFGFGIIRFAETAGFVVERLADALVEGRPAWRIAITDLERRRTDFAIDKETRLIHKVEFDTPSGHHERVYWPYDLREAVREAKEVRLSFKGHLLFHVRWASCVYGLDLPEEMFAPLSKERE